MPWVAGGLLAREHAEAGDGRECREEHALVLRREVLEDFRRAVAEESGGDLQTTHPSLHHRRRFRKLNRGILEEVPEASPEDYTAIYCT